MMKTNKEWETFKQLLALLQVRWQGLIHIGLKITFPRQHRMYRNAWFWEDGTAAFLADTFRLTGYTPTTRDDFVRGSSSLCAYLSGPTTLQLDWCHARRLGGHFVSQYTFPDSILSSEPSSNHLADYDIFHSHIQPEANFVRCAEGHVTHGFLSCDPASQCRTERYLTQYSVPSSDTLQSGSLCGAVQPDTNRAAAIIRMFVCENQWQTIPYTLVCDFR